MSQIDKVVFLPILIWFWILFFILYLFIFSNCVALGYFSLRIRDYYMDAILYLLFSNYYFFKLYHGCMWQDMYKIFFRRLIVFVKDNWYFRLNSTIVKEHLR